MIEDVLSKVSATGKPVQQGRVGASTQKEPAFKVAAQHSGDAVTSPISPRLRYDASSGVVVTEFLDGSGSIQAQAPSNAVLAYLRAGLGSDGRAVKKGESESQGSPDKDKASPASEA